MQQNPDDVDFGSRWRQIASLATLLVCGILLFTRLGHYPLWDDEAITALTAEGVWRTGDTTVEFGQNALLYRDGLLVQNLHDRATPPLQFYLAAPFVGLSGGSTFMARFPFALCGLITVAIMLHWSNRAGTDFYTHLTLCIAIACNVAMILYCRNCRYYGLAILLVTATAYAYWHARRRAGWWAVGILAALLLSAQTLAYGALIGVIVVDYFVWERKERRLSIGDWFAVIAPQLVVGIFVLSIWNPFRIKQSPLRSEGWLSDHVTFLGYNIRDMVRAEFAAGSLLVLAVVMALFSKNQLLRRVVAATLVMVLLIAVATPQVPGAAVEADIRYLAPFIPLCIVLGVAALWQLFRGRMGYAALLAPVIFGTNAVGTFLLTTPPRPLRFTPLTYAQELINPQADPFSPVIAWIRDNVEPGKTVWTSPAYCRYPLMFHAPQAVYGWQITRRGDPQFGKLPPAQFVGESAPDYVVAFGPYFEPMVKELRSHAPAARYVQVKRFDVFYGDLYRPEMIWRTFKTVTDFDPQREGVFIYQRQPAKTPLVAGRARR